MKYRKALSLVISVAMLLTFAFAAAAEEFTYPMEFDGTLTYYVALNSNVAASAATLNDTPFAQYLYDATGIKVEYLHPTSGSEAEGFNLMLASNDLADIIEFSWGTAGYYPAGLDAAITANLVTDLSQYPDLWPNYRAVLDANPTWNQAAMTDAGKYPGFKFIRGDAELQVFYGMIIRQDWLDKLGLEVPTTIDEWTNMLVAFRDEMGATTPLITRLNIPDMVNDGNAFCGAYGVGSGFYLDENGKVHYGRAEEGWQKMLELFHGWYEEGLFNQDFITDAGKDKDAHVLNGDGGAFSGYTGSGIGVYMNSAALAGDTEFNLVAAPYPVLNKGDVSMFGQYDAAVNPLIATVSPTSKNIEAAIRLLDFGYSEAGQMLLNYGKEGESYTMIDGYPTFTESVLKPEGGISIGNAIARVARSSYGGAFVQGAPYIQQYLQLPNQKEAIKVWQTNAAATKLPSISIAESDSDEYNKIFTEIDDFTKEYTALAINGTYDLANYQSEYLDVLHDIGIDRAIEIQQAAYDMYLSRGK